MQLGKKIMQFWDGIHPTAVIHKQVADIATEMF